MPPNDPRLQVRKQGRTLPHSADRPLNRELTASPQSRTASCGKSALKTSSAPEPRIVQEVLIGTPATNPYPPTQGWSRFCCASSRLSRNPPLYLDKIATGIL